MKIKGLITVFIGGLLLAAAGYLIMIKNTTAKEVYVRPDVGQEYVSSVGAGGRSDTDSSHTPVKLDIPSADISIKVAKGYYDAVAQKWTLSKDSAHYAVMTPPPNKTGGNTFIYGHNRSSVFSRLFNVGNGDFAYLTTENKQRYSYKLVRSYTTSPSDSGFLNYQGKPILTLQTCSGARFQNRSLYVFELIEVKNG